MVSISRRDARSIGEVQKLRFNPVEAVSAKGVMLFESTGRQLLDLSGGWGAMSLGYGHPAICDAVSSTVASQPGAGIISLSSVPAIELAERLLDITPLHHDDNRVVFGHSGSDANECVVRSIRESTRRKRIIAFIGSYHGGSAGSMAISAHSPYGQSSDLLLLPYPDSECVREISSSSNIIELLEHYFDTVCPPEEVGAIFLEPILADGGIVVPPIDFFQRLEAICRQHGILIVSDEVKVGLGRTGQLHGFQRLHITPDIVTFGKGLGAGLPISAAVGPAHILSHAPAAYLQTTHGNPVCAAAGLAMLDTLHQDNLIEHAARVGAHLFSRLTKLEEMMPIVARISGYGLIAGIAMHSKDNRGSANLARKVCYRSYQLGVLCYLVGRDNSVIELTPPLNITEMEIDAAIDTLSLAMQDVIDGKVSDEEIASYSGW